MFGRSDAKVIHNAIDVSRFVYDPEVRERVRREQGASDDKIALFVGRLDPQKNPVFLLNIFHEIVKREKGWQLWIVGDGVLRDEVEAKIKACGLEAQVHLLGSRSDVNELMQAADIFLLPSKFEGLGIVLIEAQAASLPCITSKDVVPREVDVTGLVEFVSLEEDAAHWAKRVMDICHSDRINRFGQIQEAGYDSAANVRNLEREYDSLIRLEKRL